jgi:hypothetical protein
MPQRMAHERSRCRGTLLVDTDVLIDDLRDQPGAVAFGRAPNSHWPFRRSPSPSSMWACAMMRSGSGWMPL